MMVDKPRASRYALSFTSGALLMREALVVAPIFPLAVTLIARRAGGEAIALVNSSRIAASFVGPVVATTLLTWTTPSLLFALLAVPGLACLPVVGRGRTSRPGVREGTR